MRVTHVITRLIVGGAQENTLSSVLGLRQKPGFQVDLISGPTEGAEGSLQPRAEAVPGLLTVIPDLIRPVRPLCDARAYRTLTRLFRAWKPEIVHTHSGKAGFLGRLAARRAGVPVIIHTIHGPSFGSFQGPVANLAFRFAERVAGHLTTHFVVVANAMRDQYLDAGIGAPGQYTRVFSGFRIEPFRDASRSEALLARHGIQPGDIVVGTIARLFELKGHDELIDIAPRLLRECPRLKFLWLGDGPWQGRLAARIGAMGLSSRFVFAGLVPPAEVAEHVACMDFLVHLSRREGLARALPQALAAGKPVVSWDIDGAREVCLDGETGFLIPVDDRERLIDRVLRLATSPDLCRQLGRAGQAMVVRDFSEQSMVDALAGLYARLVSRPVRACGDAEAVS